MATDPRVGLAFSVFKDTDYLTVYVLHEGPMVRPSLNHYEI